MIGQETIAFSRTWTRSGRRPEKALAAWLLMNVQTIPDTPSSRVVQLPGSKSQLKKMSSNDRIIFGTGDQLGIITLTGDKKAVDWAAAYGVFLNVRIHTEARYASQ